jgi:competence protein ComEA
LNGLNLAALLSDGQQVRLFSTSDPPLVPSKDQGQMTRSQAADLLNPLDLNRASVEELTDLPGIGPVTAEKIVAYRDEHGPFQTIEAILEVSGIGDATLEKIRDFITVGMGP